MRRAVCTGAAAAAAVVCGQQVLVVAEKSRDFIAQQHAFHHLTSLSALSLYSHLRTARHAVVRRRVSTSLYTVRRKHVPAYS